MNIEISDDTIKVIQNFTGMTIEEIKQVIDSIINNIDQYNKMKNIAEMKGIEEFSYSKIELKSIER